MGSEVAGLYYLPDLTVAGEGAEIGAEGGVSGLESAGSFLKVSVNGGGGGGGFGVRAGLGMCATGRVS